MKSFNRYFLSLIIFLGGISGLNAHTENTYPSLTNKENSVTDQFDLFEGAYFKTVFKSKSSHTKDHSEFSIELFDEEEEEVNSFDEDFNSADFLSSAYHSVNTGYFICERSYQSSFYYSGSPYSHWARYLVLCVFRI